MFGIFTAPESWIALFTLMLLDIFVSVDHILFISYATEKLPKGTQKKAIYSGFALEILFKIGTAIFYNPTAFPKKNHFYY